MYTSFHIHNVYVYIFVTHVLHSLTASEHSYQNQETT